MASQSKVIFITSDEDLVRQVSLKKTTNTHIIDLNNEDQVVLTLDDAHDRVYRRTLETSTPSRAKQAKVSRKSTELVCKICGDRAIGFNYDVLSCASCKAFFYRYARQDSTQLKCLTGQSQCLVEDKISRRCHRCRLQRCFTMGMRKDFILSEEENQRRRKRAEESRNMVSEPSLITVSASDFSSIPESLALTLDEVDPLLMNENNDNGAGILLHGSINSNDMIHTLLEPLTAEDLAVIHNTQSSFKSVFENQCEELTNLINLSDRTAALISSSEFAHLIGLRLVSFFRLVNEFESLHEDDRFILIKYHLLPLYPFIICYTYRSLNDCCSYGDHEEARKKRQFFVLCDQSQDMYEMYVSLILYLVQSTEQDQVLLVLLLIVMLFSPALSMNTEEPLVRDSLSINRVQSYYTRVLWNYMVNKEGETKACQRFTQLLKGIFAMQSFSVLFSDFLRSQIARSGATDQIAPLLQTFLHIS